MHSNSEFSISFHQRFARNSSFLLSRAKLPAESGAPSTTNLSSKQQERSSTMATPGNAPPPPAAAGATSSTGMATNSTASNSNGPNEEDLRKQLRAAFQNLKSREPLDPNYKRLLMNGIVTTRRPVLPKDRFYKRVGSRLRQRVETFLVQTQGKDPFDRISQRQPLEEGAMRAALTLRESKDHEQQALLDATLASLPRRNGMDELSRRRHLEGIALGLQSRQNRPLPRVGSNSPSEQTEQARQQAELERQQSQARAREAARRRREDEDRKRREDENKQRRSHVETSQQALHKLYQPIFRKLWDMEFVHLGGINPFRIVIDRDNCAAVGAPDYFQYVETEMNLTYISDKVDRMAYDSLSSFIADVDLIIQNALKYNSDPGNPYRIAAEEMKKRYMKIVKKVLQSLKQQR